jgi:tRNA 2-(methylsulfanyl)-N6-isopentenyladenosine37 hydroxylase
MLGLKLPSDPRWVKIAEKNIDEILIDHAYCEQKAALSCVSLIILYPERKELRDALMPIVTEEWAHFRMVIAEMDKRGIALGPARKDEYVLGLQAYTTKGGSKNQQLCEKLFVNALIEARSCERFRLLSLEISDESLKQFYHQLMVSEAGHYRLFLDLAKNYMPENYIKTRWEEWLQIEAKIMQQIGISIGRVH